MMEEQVFDEMCEGRRDLVEPWRAVACGPVVVRRAIQQNLYKSNPRVIVCT